MQYVRDSGHFGVTSTNRMTVNRDEMQTDDLSANR